VVHRPQGAGHSGADDAGSQLAQRLHRSLRVHAQPNWIIKPEPVSQSQFVGITNANAKFVDRYPHSNTLIDHNSAGQCADSAADPVGGRIGVLEQLPEGPVGWLD